MMGHKICLNGEIWLIIPKLSLLPFLIWSTGETVLIAYRIYNGIQQVLVKLLPFVVFCHVALHGWVFRKSQLYNFSV